MTAIMEAPYPQTYHANALTIFIMARSFGAGVDAAYVAQAAATLAAIAAAVWLWLPSTAIDPRRRALATATLAIVATPYGYTYDTIPMCVALAYMFAVTEKPQAVLLSLAWLFPAVAQLLNYEGIGIGVLVPIAVAVWMSASAVTARRIRARWGRRRILRSTPMTTVAALGRLTKSGSEDRVSNAGGLSVLADENPHRPVFGQRTIGLEERRSPSLSAMILCQNMSLFCVRIRSGRRRSSSERFRRGVVVGDRKIAVGVAAAVPARSRRISAKVPASRSNMPRPSDRRSCARTDARQPDRNRSAQPSACRPLP